MRNRHRRRTARSPGACRIAALLLLGLAPAVGQTGAGSGGLFDSLSSLGERLGITSASKPSKPFLEPDKAFVFAVDTVDGRMLTARWRIAEGYYLYRDKFSFRLRDAGGVTLGDPEMPAGEPKEDETFGLTEVYYGRVRIRLPLRRPDAGDGRIVLEASYQGCADDGFCYPPMTRSVGLVLPAPR